MIKLLSFLLLAGTAIPVHSAVVPAELRCEYRVNPLGIDSPMPRLSWLVTADPAARGVSQSAYRVIVASSPQLVDQNAGDLWDTGKVASPQSIQLPYAGKALGSGVRVFWKVQIWDRGGNPSPWSAVNYWSEGLLKASDWTAQWIGHDGSGLEKDPASPFRYLGNARWIWNEAAGAETFERQIEVNSGEPLRAATVVMAANSSFELFINDVRIRRGDFFRSPEIIDVARFFKPGSNSVRVIAHPSQSLKSGLIGSFHLEAKNGESHDVVTDRAWTVSGQPAMDLGAYGAEPWGEVGYSEARYVPARFLRKEFAASRHLVEATAYVSGLGLSELYVNGHKMGDAVLSPGLTDYGKRVQYVTYDISSALTSGKNAVGLILGNGRFWAPRATVPFPTRSFGYPKARVQIEIKYADGHTQTVLSDATWKLSSGGPIRGNNEYDGEEYDARLEVSGWDRAGFRDREWQNADLVTGPSGFMAAQNAEPMRVMQTLKPVKVTEVRPGVYIADMGQNMVGWCRLHVKGRRGTTVQLRHAETLDAAGELYTENLRSARATDTYTLKGSGTEVWQPRFTYHGFRYVEIRGYPGVPDTSTLEGEVIHDAMENTGEFTSSSSMLNKIHHNLYWGIRGNYRSIPTDCPQRDERQGWLGDRSVVSRCETYFFNVAAFYDKWERDLADAQNAAGSIPDVAPTYWMMYNDDVTWPSTFIQIPTMLYDQYADRRVIEETYPAMKRWIDHMRGYLKDGLLAKDTYGDWCVPPENPKLIHSEDPARRTDGTLLATGYFYMMNRQMERFARLLGKSEDAAEFHATAATVKEAFNQHFYQPANGYYANNTQTANIIPLAFGIVPEYDRSQVVEHLLKNIETQSDGHTAAGLVGAQWQMRALSESNRPDVAFQMIVQPTYPGWGYMAAKGATTVWELWNGDTADPAMNSGNHVMQIGDLGLFMYQELAGIRPDPEQPGFKHIIVKPHPLAALTFVKASHVSPFGKISSHWQRSEGMLTLDLIIPPNTTATVYLPGADAAIITEGGRPAAQAPGVKPSGSEKGEMVFEVGSGTYSFRLPDPVKGGQAGPTAKRGH